MPDIPPTTDLANVQDLRPKAALAADPPDPTAALLPASHPALAAMLVAARTPQEFRAASQTIEARIAAENEAELQAESLAIQRVASQVGPYIIDRNKEKNHAW